MVAETNKISIPKGTITIKKDWCKGCGLCVDICPKGLISLDELGKIQIKEPEKCIGCGQCEAICPDFVIKVDKHAKTD